MDYTGISFPFRLNSKGGIQLSQVNSYTSKHIEESIYQILTTKQGERLCSSFGSSLSSYLFDPQSESTITLLKYEIMQALSIYEKRIVVKDSDISISMQDNKILVTISYYVKDVDTTFTSDFNLGGE